MSDVPPGNGWHEVPLSDLIEPLQTGSRPKGGVRHITEGIPSIGGEHLTASGGFDFTNVKYVPRDFYASMKRGRIERGDILVVKDGATTGKVALVTADFPFADAVVNEHVFICRPRPGVSSEFLFSFLYSPEGQERILQHFAGAAQGGINQSFATGTLVPVPPDDEQERILSWLTAALKKQLSASSRLLRAQRLVEALDAAVLSAAYDDAIGAADGKLTELRELLEEPLRNGYSAKPVADETPFRVLTLTATTSGRFDARHFKYTREEVPFDSGSWVEPGDILVQRGNTEEYVGVSALYEGESKSFIYPDLMIRVRVREEIGRQFVACMLLAPAVRQFLRDRATGAAGNMPKINQQALASVPLPVPDEASRIAIVSRVQAASNLLDVLRQRMSRATQSAAHLEHALLAKAFRGDLSVNGSNDGA